MIPPMAIVSTQPMPPERDHILTQVEMALRREIARVKAERGRGKEAPSMPIVERGARMPHAGPPVESLRPSQAVLMDQTWQAILAVESGNGRDQRCWTESPDRSLGPAQMRRCRVDDCNRILGRPAYTYADRLDRGKCREMFGVSCRHYWPRGGPEQWARHWNGSPTKGPTSPATARYWGKIQAAMIACAKRSAQSASRITLTGDSAPEAHDE